LSAATGHVVHAIDTRTAVATRSGGPVPSNGNGGHRVGRANRAKVVVMVAVRRRADVAETSTRHAPDDGLALCFGRVEARFSDRAKPTEKHFVLLLDAYLIPLIV